nr:MAG TPA_asm: hypothetical protein [Caudoviricetes sp.]
MMTSTIRHTNIYSVISVFSTVVVIIYHKKAIYRIIITLR